MGEKQTRIKNVYINSTVALVCQIFQVMLGFISRRVFIQYLGIEYLGYNSVFQNILQMLNLADLGIGVAITSFLYKPLALGARNKVNALMCLYKKTYRILGIIVLFLGIFISFFLKVLIPDAQCSQPLLQILFYINLMGTVSTYFLAYKRTLLIADQRSYAVSLIDTVVSILITLIQIVLLYFIPDYILFLLLGLLKNVLANIIVLQKANKDYEESSYDETIVEEYKPLVIKYIKELFISKIGAYIYYSTDNIIISVIKGSLLTGYLSNYTLVTTQVTTLVNQVLASIQATFGNFINTNEDVEQQKEMTDIYLCVNYCIGNFCMICIMFLIQPFIQSLFGKEYLLNISTVMLLAVNMLLTILIQLPSQIFMIYKLYKYDQPIIICTAIINIVISVLLVRELGIDGVLIGTVIASLIYLFSRFYIISKYVYSIPFKQYIYKLVSYFLISLANILIVSVVVKNIVVNTISSFGIRIICVVGLAILIPASLLILTKEFKLLLNKMLPSLSMNKKIKYMTWGMAIVYLIIFSCFGKMSNKEMKLPYEGNKSIIREDSYEDSGEEYSYKVFHISIDDFIDTFEDITINEYKSIFENDTFEWLKDLHDNYGGVVSCYVYYQKDGFSLDECSKQYKKEFEENSDWLRFGFHSLNGNTIYGENIYKIEEDYKRTIDCLENIVGEKSIDNIVRLASFQGSSNEIISLSKMSKQPVIGYLTADDYRVSYGLSDEKNKYIYSHDRYYDEKNNIMFFSSDLRAELIENVEEKIKEFETNSWNNQLNDIIIFTHEWSLDKTAKRNVEKLLEYAVSNSYEFIFLEDIKLEN